MGSREASGDGCAPEHQDINAGIGRAVVTQRTGDFFRRVFGAPRLRPGPHASFKIGRDPVGDASINILLSDPVVMSVAGAGVHDVLLFDVDVGSLTSAGEPTQPGRRTGGRRERGGGRAAGADCIGSTVTEPLVLWRGLCGAAG